MSSIIQIREALTKHVSENIVSYMRENDLTPIQYLAELAIVAEITEEYPDIKEGIAYWKGQTIAVIRPNSPEEEIWRIIGTIKLRHHDPIFNTNRPQELEYFLSQIRRLGATLETRSAEG